MAFRRVLIAITLLIGGSLTGGAQSDSIPLGDVARQKPARKAQRVITDDDLPPRPVPPPDAADTVADKVAVAKPADSAVAKPANDDLAATRKALEELLAKQQALNSEIANLKQQADDAPVDARRDVLLDVISRRTSDLETTRASIATTEQHLLELLRKESVPSDDSKASKDSKADASASAGKTADNPPATEAAQELSPSQAKD